MLRYLGHFVFIIILCVKAVAENTEVVRVESV